MTTQFQPGQRVTAIRWGRHQTGTVAKHTSSVVWVRWDGRDTASWQHPESLTLVTLSPAPAGQKGA